MCVRLYVCFFFFFGFAIKMNNIEMVVLSVFCVSLGSEARYVNLYTRGKKRIKNEIE